MAIPIIPSSQHSNKEFEYIAFERNQQKDVISKALGIVHEYIIEKQLILTGGMAIDFALKHAGKSGIYDDKTLPDYDVFSPAPDQDAYEIAKRLCVAELPKVGVINAMHTTTLRVRVEYITVADITFVPQSIYDKIPRLVDKAGFQIEHPHFKYINQHKGLSLLYENPPFETILHRFKKDAQRHDLLYAAYPIEYPTIKPALAVISLSPLVQKRCLGGWGALAYYSTLSINAGRTPRDVEFEWNGQTYKAPEQCSTQYILAHDYHDLISATCGSANKPIKYLADWLDMLPQSALLETACIYDYSHTFIAALSEDTFWIAHPQQIMYWMLVMYYQMDDPIYLYGYCHMREIVMWAHTTLRVEREPWSFSELILTHRKYGDKNLSHSKQLKLYELGALAHGRTPHTYVPKKFYPDPAKECAIGLQLQTPFDPKSSPLWTVDGSEMASPKLPLI
jgi:hypothetical protein